MTSRWLGIVAVAFVAGSFVASPELRAYAAATIGSAEIIDESIQSLDIKNGQVKSSDLAGSAVTSIKIKDGEVKAADIADDAVGASEIQGVSKLTFYKYTLSNNQATQSIPGDDFGAIAFSVPGIEQGDNLIAVLNGATECISISGQAIANGAVEVILSNHCNFSSSPEAGSYISIMVFATSI